MGGRDEWTWDYKILYEGDESWERYKNEAVKSHSSNSDPGKDHAAHQGCAQAGGSKTRQWNMWYYLLIIDNIETVYMP